MAVSKVMTVLTQDAYDADAYRGAIGAKKEAREKAKRESAEASTLICNLIAAGHELMKFPDQKASEAFADALRKVAEE